MEVTKTYVAGNFIDESSDDGKPVVELIPSSWLIFETDGTVKQTMYPPVDDFPRVKKWIQECRDPDDTRESHNIKTLSQANDYEQGIRRVDRAVINPDRRLSSECTDDSSNENNNFMELEKRINTILNQCQQIKSQNTRNIHDNPSTSMVVGIEKKIVDNNKVNNPLFNKTKGDQSSKNDRINDTIYQLENLRLSINGDPLKQFIADYLDAKFVISEENILNKISNTKRSLQYDFKATISSVKENPPASLIFLDFDTSISTSDDGTPESLTTKQTALTSLFSSATSGQSNAMKDLGIMIQLVIKKSVQLLYSGAGRNVKGQQKLNFSATTTFKLITAFLENKYAGSPLPLNIRSMASDFLSGAGDREGGHKERQNNRIQL